MGRGAIETLADKTPATRDRYVDFLRALSICVVVFGHWLMAIVYFGEGRLEGASALDVVPGLWAATWVLQVMPLFFIVGGFSNRGAWHGTVRRGESYAVYLRSRTVRLIRPTMAFVCVWTGLALGARLLNAGSAETLSEATALIAKPLWFLAVYVLVVALAPVMLALHERHGVRVLILLAGAAVGVDVLRVGFGVPVVGYLNFAFVWLFAHQLGFFYGDGALSAFSRRFFVKVGATALAVLAVLTGSGIYSPSMVGMASDKASNNSPPSVCLIALTVWLLGAAMVARPTITRWLARKRPWMGVVAANSMIMTVFLWHLTAALLAVMVLYPLGFPQPDGGSALWWAWRPVWLLALVAFLAPLTLIFARFERPAASHRRLSPTAIPRLLVAGGIAALVAGLGGLAQFGFAMGDEVSLFAQPLVNAALVFFGYVALTRIERTGGAR